MGDALQPQGTARPQPGREPAREQRRRGRLPDGWRGRRHQGRRWHRRGDPAGHHLPAAEPARRRLGQWRHRAGPGLREHLARPVPDRRGRQPGRRLRAGRGRQLDPVVLDRRPAPGGGRRLHPGPDRDLLARDRHRLRRRHLRRGALLLPGRQEGVPRHHVLQGHAGGAARREGRPVLAGLRAGPRVRPPRAGPARHDGQGAHPAGPQQRRGAPGAAGRLLRGHLDQARHQRRRQRRGALHRRPHPGRHRTGPGRGRRGRRRPDPAQDLGSRGPGQLDARVRRVRGCGGSPPACRRAPCGPATRSPRSSSERPRTGTSRTGPPYPVS